MKEDKKRLRDKWAKTLAKWGYIKQDGNQVTLKGKLLQKLVEFGPFKIEARFDHSGITRLGNKTPAYPLAMSLADSILKEETCVSYTRDELEELRHVTYTLVDSAIRGGVIKLELGNDGLWQITGKEGNAIPRTAIPPEQFQKWFEELVKWGYAQPQGKEFSLTGEFHRRVKENISSLRIDIGVEPPPGVSRDDPRAAVALKYASMSAKNEIREDPARFVAPFVASSILKGKEDFTEDERNEFGAFVYLVVKRLFDRGVVKISLGEGPPPNGHIGK